jgi:hypothetical protein
MVGAATDVRGPDATIQDVVAAATPAILTAGRAIGVSSHSRLSVVEYRSQVVAGTNFFVKIRAEHSPTEFIACRLFRPLPPNHKEIEVVKCKPIDEETNVQYF